MPSTPEKSQAKPIRNLDRQVVIRLSSAEHEKYAALAEHEERPVAAQIRRLARMGLEGSTPKRRAR